MQHVNDSKNRKRILLTCLIYDFQQKKKLLTGNIRPFLTEKSTLFDIIQVLLLLTLNKFSKLAHFMPLVSLYHLKISENFCFSDV